MFIPEYVAVVLSKLREADHSAYLVGGCVRDSLLGKTPDDFDITTSALPGEMQRVFESFKTVDVGIEHGTLTVISEGHPIEITTYRLDGEYEDHRHPTGVCFSSRLEDDLSRRDFTVNAMAAGENGVVDLFGGREDLSAGIIRCVGNAEKRFDEDALRILRALRFASKLGFQIEETTERAIFEKYELLRFVSRERIFKELCGILMGGGVFDVLMKYSDVICYVVPEMKDAVGCDQMTPYHKYNVYEHTAHAVAYCEKDIVVRLAAFLHDVAKPRMKTVDENGRGHFKRHADVGSDMAEDILKGLRCPAKITSEVGKLIKLHDLRPKAEERELRRYLVDCADCDIEKLMALRRGDMKAKKSNDEGLDYLDASLDMIRSLIADKAPRKVSELDIGGGNVAELGARGAEIGDVLKYLLHSVADMKVKNEKSELISLAKLYIRDKFGINAKK